MCVQREIYNNEWVERNEWKWREREKDEMKQQDKRNEMGAGSLASPRIQTPPKSSLLA
jgi:hypothetical protein